ncbi:MAG: hypothetical protein IKH78_00295, partial [Ruminococcus sp.]|nr:hypothetical protein [Ruminococcus sp.]
WAMAFGCMVGWGTFVMPGTTFLPVAGPAGTVIAMVIGICIMLVIGCNIPILAITANAFKEDEEKAKEAGMQAHIAKPIDVDKLLVTLAKVLSEHEK